MVRTQIRLTEQQVEKVRREASRIGISMAEFVRRALDNALAASGSPSSVRQRSLRVIGCVASGTGDLSEKHDNYLGEAYRL